MKNYFREIKWAYQRVFRGYDDSAFWNLDYYLASIALPVLKNYRDNKCGLMHNHEYTGTDFDKGWHTEESQKELFDKMIYAMESCVDDLEHIEKVLGKDYSKEQLQEYERKVHEGCQLFGEYFRGLWT